MSGYVEDLDEDDDVMTVSTFSNACTHGHFIDYDGFGHPVKEGKANPSIYIRPSELEEIPADATHIVWFNR